MKALIAVVAFAFLFSCSSDEAKPVATASTSTVDLGPHWRSNLLECTPQICGQVAQNDSPYKLESGVVEVSVDGLVTIRLHRMTDTNGVIGSYRELQVFHGRFSPTRHFEEIAGRNPLIGTIKTDRNGDFEGPITTDAGKPFTFGPGVAITGQFAINQPGVRTLFITEPDS